MSIPKEPRQLMINIMYLVLTALLALNVSAEIFNAFKVVDKGLKQSSVALDASNSSLPPAIREGAKKRPDLEQYADRIDGIRETSSDLSSYIQEIIDYMIDQTGDKDGSANEGDYVDINGVHKLIGQKNKDVTTRYLVQGDQGKDPVGPQLKAKIEEAYAKFMTFIDEEDQGTIDFPLKIDDVSWQAVTDPAKRSWTAFNFRQMPLQATLPILDKFINDAKASEAEALNYLLKKVGTDKAVVLDEFIVISSPKRSYVIKGDTYETELALGAAASQNSNTTVSISVNGTNVSLTNGKGKWTQRASTLGKKKYTAVARVTNPVTDETKSYTSEYEYEVGERSVSVSASKMNVFYMGVSNPVTVTAAGVPSNQVNVSMSGSGGGKINKNGDGTYTVTVSGPPTRVGQFANINVSAPGLTEAREFRVKRIPDPVARLSASAGGVMGSGEFKAQIGLGAFLDNFDFDAKCQIQGYKLVHVPKRQDAAEAINGGSRYGSEAQRLIAKAKPGDVYYYENVKAKCPGDAAGRTINSLVFKIK